MSFFEELENILSKAKAENSAPETAEEPAQPPAHTPDVIKPPAALAPVGLAVSPALSVPAPVAAAEVAPVPTIAEPVATTTTPALSLAVPAPLTLAPAPVAEVSAPTLTASASAGLPSRPSFNSATGEKLPSLSLATEEPQEEEPVKTVRPSLVAASIAEVLAANKPSGLPVRPDTAVSVSQTENGKSPAAPDIEEEGEEWDGVALPSADSLVVAQAPVLAAKAEVVSADPQNYIAAVSHAEDVTIRTNSLPEIKPAGQEYFFEDDDEEPVVF